jgi:hypothetical protein
MNGGWSQTAYYAPHTKGVSAHRSQLDATKEKVLRLSILNPDGTTTNIDGPKGRLKLAFTGGNDDSSLELQLQQFSPYSPVELDFPFKIIYKFSAFPSSKVDPTHDNRAVQVFRPAKRLDQSQYPVVDERHQGPTNFTDALYHLCWESFEKDEVECIRLTWKSNSIVTFGLSLEALASPEYIDIARMFCSISENQKRHLSRELKFTVELRDVPDLQYRYRYLLASETHLPAY